MTKPTSTSTFRLLTTLLLLIQACCWALTLLDLFSPGKPLLLLRASTNILSNILTNLNTSIIAQMSSGQYMPTFTGTLLSYRDVDL
ncbi:hypothetical protein CC80DRAFT_545214 [Byssothecium circinans]|uniref:Uncharacterized protein n=1 Tax=Byssothecium circinans TaxID=147558 RepID=A0A6A5U628_9PLEO|nr:hypothetical protein CC80DRAFT_545214 [Byssothecium circinans]